MRTSDLRGKYLFETKQDKEKREDLQVIKRGSI